MAVGDAEHTSEPTVSARIANQSAGIKKTADSRGSGSSQTAPKPSYYFPRLTYSGRIDLARAYSAQEVANFAHTIDTQRNLNTNRQLQEILLSNFIWIIAIGFIAGLIVRFVSPGPNGASGFILRTVLGIAGAFVATFIGQTIGRYQLDRGAGLIGATVGPVIVLIIGNRLVVHHLSAIRARDRRAAGYCEPAGARIFEQCGGENISTDCH